MNIEINYQNNPLHGVGLKTLLTEIVDHYGFEILFAYLNINCFKNNPSIASSIKFLKKTDWAREKVESFYLYQFRNLPKASPDQFSIPPRERVIPEGQIPGAPAELDLDDADRLRQKREQKAGLYEEENSKRWKSKKPVAVKQQDQHAASRAESRSAKTVPTGVDPWAKARKKPGNPAE